MGTRCKWFQRWLGTTKRFSSKSALALSVSPHPLPLPAVFSIATLKPSALVNNYHIIFFSVSLHHHSSAAFIGFSNVNLTITVFRV